MSSSNKNFLVFANNTTYDRLKQTALIVVPALGTLYAGMAAIWGFPYSEQVTATCVTITTFLGVVLNISSANYKSSGEAYDGTVVVNTTDPASEVVEFKDMPHPLDLADKDEILLNVVDTSDPNQLDFPDSQEKPGL